MQTNIPSNLQANIEQVRPALDQNYTTYYQSSPPPPPGGKVKFYYLPRMGRGNLKS